MPKSASHYSAGKSAVDQIPPELLLEWGDVFTYGMNKYFSYLPIDKACYHMVQYCTCNTVTLIQISKFFVEVCAEIVTKSNYGKITLYTPSASVKVLGVGQQEIKEDFENIKKSIIKTLITKSEREKLLGKEQLNPMESPSKTTLDSIQNSMEIAFSAESTEMFLQLIMTILQAEFGDYSVSLAILDWVCSEILKKVYNEHSPTCESRKELVLNIDGSCTLSARGNWKGGKEWYEFYGSALRHIYKWYAGEDNDAESGLPNLAMAIWNLGCLRYYQLHDLGIDTRDKYE